MLAIYHNGNLLLMTREAMDALKLRDGQHVDEPTMWRAIDLNTAAMRAHVEANPNCDPTIRAKFDQVMETLEPITAKFLGK